VLVAAAEAVAEALVVLDQDPVVEEVVAVLDLL